MVRARLRQLDVHGSEKPKIHFEEGEECDEDDVRSERGDEVDAVEAGPPCSAAASTRQARKRGAVQDQRTTNERTDEVERDAAVVFDRSAIEGGASSKPAAFPLTRNVRSEVCRNALHWLEEEAEREPERAEGEEDDRGEGCGRRKSQDKRCRAISA